MDLAVDAIDAEGLQAVRLVYVRMSGSGESFAFDEGQVPVTLERLERAATGAAAARLVLSALQLEDGDSLVYRALVRDTNPSRRLGVVGRVHDRRRQAASSSPAPASPCPTRTADTR